MGQFALFAIDQTNELKLIGERYADFLMDQSPDEQTIKGYLDTFDWERGAWNDIDYECMIGSGWKSVNHSIRTAQLAMFYRKYPADNSSFTHKRLSDAIHAAWGYWLREKPVCPTNWFPNMISTPLNLGYSFILLQDEMTADELDVAIDFVMSKPTISKTGSNLTYMANNVLMRSILVGDTEMARKAIDAIIGTVFISEIGEEGYQEDNSYMLHGAQQQMGNYGREGLKTMSLFCTILNGTSFDLTYDQKKILANFMADGYGWILWHSYMDMNASGRQYGENLITTKGADIVNISACIAPTLSSDDRERVEKMVERNLSDDAINDLVGQKSFYCSDCMNHRRPQWAASLKMHSIRVFGGEQSENDNRKGLYSPDGALYTYVDGDEYENASLLWNWHKIPGTTCYDYDFDEPLPIKGGKLPTNNSRFVGTCTDNITGVSTMILNREGLFARKTWVATKDFVLSLGCDIRDSSGERALATTIDQKIKRAPLLYLDSANNWQNVGGRKLLSDDNRRLYHDKTGYIILDNNELVAEVESRSEDWFNISRTHASNIKSDDMMTIYLKHPKPDGEYSYIILPARSQDEVRDFDTSKVEILSNTKRLQMVKYDGCYYVVAFENGTYDVENSLLITISQPGLYMIQKDGADWSITAHDPTKRLSDISMRDMISIE